MKPNLKKNIIKYYIIPVSGCTDPDSLVGPYKTYKSMLRSAKRIRAKQDESDALFYLLLDDSESYPFVGSFTNGEIEDPNRVY